MSSGPICPSRLRLAKVSYAARRISLPHASTLLTGNRAPRAGEVALARVESLGQHKRLELATGRRATLHIGDEIVVCFGDRYAPDQFEAEVPPSLSSCDLVAAGGIASHTRSRHASMRRPTKITPLGILANADGMPLNVADYAIDPRQVVGSRPPVIAVLGASMNSGKTTTVSGLILGLTRAGYRVGAAKATGTGSGGDTWSMIDAGATEVVDFSHCGAVTTYKLPIAQCESILETLVAYLADRPLDAIVVEVADGILQRETRELVASATFKRLVDEVVFAAPDALSAITGVRLLNQMGHHVDAISGLVTASPLAVGECRSEIGLPFLTLGDLQAGAWIPSSLAAAAACDGTDELAKPMATPMKQIERPAVDHERIGQVA